MTSAQTIIYKKGNLKAVKRTSSSGRALLTEGELDVPQIEGRRLRFDDCTDCEEAFDTVCDAALSVCDLEDFGYPFTATAAASIDTACGTFGSACSRLEASVACQDQCTEEGVYYCKPRFVQCLASSTSIRFSYFSRRCVFCLLEVLVQQHNSFQHCNSFPPSSILHSAILGNAEVQRP